MNPTPLRIIFFDLGDTLVQKIAVSPSGEKFDWVPGAKELLTRLRQVNLGLGVISNTGTLQRNQLLQRLPQDFSFDIFDADLVLLSSEVELEKPDPRIFRLAVNRAQNNSDPDMTMRVDPRDCLYCGESLEEVLVAQHVGMLSARVQLTPQPDIGRLDDFLKNVGFLP